MEDDNIVKKALIDGIETSFDAQSSKDLETAKKEYENFTYIGSGYTVRVGNSYTPSKELAHFFIQIPAYYSISTINGKDIIREALIDGIKVPYFALTDGNLEEAIVTHSELLHIGSGYTYYIDGIEYVCSETLHFFAKKENTPDL